MWSPRRQSLLVLILTSLALPQLVRLSLAIYSAIQRSIATFSLFKQQVDVLIPPALKNNWRTLVATLLTLTLPAILYAITFQPTRTRHFVDTVKDAMTNYMTTGAFSGAPKRRSLLKSSRSSQGVDQEVYNTVMQRGGNIGGLVNDGNTCFMNSVLQSLASSNTLLDLLEHESDELELKTKNDKEVRFIKALKTLVDKLNHKHFNGGRDYKTNAVLRTMTKTPNKNFLLGYNQEDAQEFFQTILSELESELKELHKSEDESSPSSPSSSSSSPSANAGPVYVKDLPEDAVIGNNNIGHLGTVYLPASQIDPNLSDSQEKMFPFNLLTPVDGLSAERIGCLKCGEMGGIRYSLISGLSLNLPADNYRAIKLTELLNNWIEPEIISGVDCNRCALNHVLEYQESQLLKLQEDGVVNSMLVEKFSERIDTIKHELTKPIIDDEVVKKLYTKNMMQKSSKSKQILISRPPPLLSMHINRSVFDPLTFRVRKNGARVVFPLKLDLDHYVAETNEINTDARLPLSKKHESLINNNPEAGAEEEEQSESETPSVVSAEEEAGSLEETIQQTPQVIDEDIELNGKVQVAEEEEGEGEGEGEEGEASDDDSSDDELVVRHPTQIPTSLEKQDISGPLVYQLRSVIVHYGTHNYGHYIAYRKYRGVWWRTSDENVDIVDEDEVLSAPGVFMLFYELDSLCQELAKDETEVVTTTTTTTTTFTTDVDTQSSGRDDGVEQVGIEMRGYTQEQDEEDKELIDDDSAEQQALNIASI